jgi:hypothetical protein
MLNLRPTVHDERFNRWHRLLHHRVRGGTLWSRQIEQRGEFYDVEAFRCGHRRRANFRTIMGADGPIYLRDGYGADGTGRHLGPRKWRGKSQQAKSGDGRQIVPSSPDMRQSAACPRASRRR